MDRGFPLRGAVPDFFVVQKEYWALDGNTFDKNDQKQKKVNHGFVRSPGPGEEETH